ncbi:MAG TPA: hypothetical protein VIL42_10510 [Sphingomicrobium sp.]|jgi:hypothetical protein
MLRVPAPFPQVGSYALIVDEALPVSQQRAELVRVQRRDTSSGEAAIAFPLRVGASSFRIVDEWTLIDGTPLTKDEERELADLQRHLFGRTRLSPKLKEQAARAEALKNRQVASVLLEAELRKLHAAEARGLRRGGGSTGQVIADTLRDTGLLRNVA